MLKFFGKDSVLDLGESKDTLAAAAELESALVEHVYSSPQTALRHLQTAASALGMQTVVEGQMSIQQNLHSTSRPSFFALNHLSSVSKQGRLLAAIWRKALHR